MTGMFETREELSAVNGQGSRGEVEQQCRLQALDKEVQGFVLASHLIWGLWSMQQMVVSDIDFNYSEYARLRLEKFVEGVTLL